MIRPICLPLLALLSAAAPSGGSILMQPISPGMAPPPVQVLADTFLPTEAGPCPAAPYAARLCQFSALDDAFADAGHRAQFRADIAPYLTHRDGRFGPKCGATGLVPVQLFTYAKPYEFSQAAFLAGRNGRDFLPPGARTANDWRGDRQCPLGADVDPRKTFGSSAWFGPAGAVLQTDNRLNPYRWIAPLNQIHHHEQPSLSLLLRTTPAGAAASAALLAAALRGPTPQRLVLDYDLDLTVTDERAAMGEKTASDMMRDADGTDLFSRTTADLAAYAARMGAASPEIIHLQKYDRLRRETPTIQLSLAVNFQNDGVRWHDAEFMLAGKNYAPSATANFAPVSDPAWLPFIPEGGNSGKVGWNRLRIDGLAQSRIPRGLHPIRAGGAYEDIPDGPSTRHLSGQIDLTDYYRFAIRARIFPGTSGTWNGTPQSSIDPATGALDALEHHRINSVGVINEVHGPFAVKLAVHRLDVRIE